MPNAQTQQPDPPDRSDRLGYFVLRVRRAAQGSEELTGVVERLGTGEKRAFRGAAELADLIEQWSP